MNEKKLLLVVDYQNDFVDGALANPAAVPLASGIAQLVKQYIQNDDYIIFTKDTHEKNYLKTREGMHLPIEHCINGTKGHELHPLLLQAIQNANSNKIMQINKPTFGAKDLPSQIEEFLKGAPVEIDICGVVSEICVISNAIILHSNFLNAKINIYENLCAGLSTNAHDNAMGVLKGMGYNLLKW